MNSNDRRATEAFEKGWLTREGRAAHSTQTAFGRGNNLIMRGAKEFVMGAFAALLRAGEVIKRTQRTKGRVNEFVEADYWVVEFVPVTTFLFLNQI